MVLSDYKITDLAQDRKRWRGIASQIEKAVDVSQTKNWDARRQQVSKSVSNFHHDWFLYLHLTT